MENSNYKNKIIISKNEFLKVKNFRIRKKFIELEDKKIRKEIEELFLKPIVISIDDMDRFEIKEMKKIRPGKNTWCH